MSKLDHELEEETQDAAYWRGKAEGFQERCRNAEAKNRELVSALKDADRLLEYRRIRDAHLRISSALEDSK